MTPVTINFPEDSGSLSSPEQQSIAWTLILTWCYDNGMREFYDNIPSTPFLNGPETIAQWIQDLKDDLEHHKQGITDTLSFLDKALQAGNEHSN